MQLRGEGRGRIGFSRQACNSHAGDGLAGITNCMWEEGITSVRRERGNDKREVEERRGRRELGE